MCDKTKVWQFAIVRWLQRLKFLYSCLIFSTHWVPKEVKIYENFSFEKKKCFKIFSSLRKNKQRKSLNFTAEQNVFAATFLEFTFCAVYKRKILSGLKRWRVAKSHFISRKTNWQQCKIIRQNNDFW